MITTGHGFESAAIFPERGPSELLFHINDTFGNAPQVIYANDGAAGDSFGASVELEGNQLVVGAPGCDPSGKSEAGAWYVFNTGFFFNNQTANLVPGNGLAGDGLGELVALRGNRVIGGAPWQSRAGRQDGVVYVFAASPAWQQEATLTVPSDTFFQTAFGSQVSLGNNYAVGGSEFARPFGGRFQVYQRVDATWFRRGLPIRRPPKLFTVSG